ncbi:hypothetical protein OUZ56_009708 [Daphnia magna]|uniref:Uncharacterized protein n=1 Tax=Daphnia magna TaxID=35525 RepID=A0ABR0AGT1_9CRUS|nr:hypothetical protein OUZ56_009708 [Daphnia magna]
MCPNGRSVDTKIFPAVTPLARASFSDGSIIQVSSSRLAGSISTGTMVLGGSVLPVLVTSLRVEVWPRSVMAFTGNSPSNSSAPFLDIVDLKALELAQEVISHSITFPLTFIPRCSMSSSKAPSGAPSDRSPSTRMAHPTGSVELVVSPAG